MPRQNLNDTLPNVASIFYQWSGDEGHFKHYDKDKKENVITPISSKQPFTFMVLASCSTIKGYSDSEGSGFWSNEVKDLKTDPLTVRTKGGPVAVGLYADIKDKITAKGAKFCQSVYVAMKGENGLEIRNIQMVGSALSAWLDFSKNNKIYEVAIQVKESKQEKKGKTVYQVPVFTSVKVSAKTDDEAGKLQEAVQEYLTAYFAKNASSAPVEVKDEVEEGTKAKAPVKAKKETSPVVDEGNDIIGNEEEDLDPPF